MRRPDGGLPVCRAVGVAFFSTMSMSTTTDGATITVALLGNPNTGKSTLFSALVGVSQRIGNYPGVTVEKKLGETTLAGQRFTVIDLPGTYSLAPRSPDEMVAVDVLLGRRKDVPPPDVIVCIVDASNLERNLYLVSQALELGRPLVLALNKIDIARERGMSIDMARFRERLGIPVVEMQAHRRVGLDDLRRALISAAGSAVPPWASPFPPNSVRKSRSSRPHGTSGLEMTPRGIWSSGCCWTRATIWRTRTSLATTRYWSHEVRAARQRLAAAGCPVPAVETASRYRWVEGIVHDVVQKPVREPIAVTDRIDRVLTHPAAGVLIFLVLMVIVFQSIFSWAAPFQDALERFVAAVGDASDCGHCRRAYCSRCWPTASWREWVPCWRFCRRLPCYFCSWRYWKTAATWRERRI